MEQVVQGTAEWHAARLGKVTASRVADIVARTKTGWSARRGNYLAELVAERLTAARTKKFVTPAMDWGKRTEANARAYYEFIEDVDVELVGFFDHPTIPMTGASPDGFVGADGMIEIKCPNTQTHLDTIAAQAVPAEHLIQIHWQMACCPDRKWCDYSSQDPRLPDHLREFRLRVMRDDAAIAELEKLVSEFLAEVDAKVAELTSCAEAA
jgi:putative phage-type endonuclease